MKIPANGIQINLHDRGEGEPALLFLHYWGGSARTWDGVIDALGSRFRTIATDHRGWGDSEAPAQGYALADLADDAQAVIAALGLKRYALIGHSMGGKVAQLLASRQPAGLERLVLVAPSPPTATIFPDEQREAQLHAYDTRESIGYVRDQLMTAGQLSPEQKEQVVEDSLRGAPQARDAWPLQGMLEDISGAAATIRIPTLVIGGELDQIDTVETLQNKVLPLIAGARLLVLKDCGHLSPLEAPIALAAAIRDFVS